MDSWIRTYAEYPFYSGFGCRGGAFTCPEPFFILDFEQWNLQFFSLVSHDKIALYSGFWWEDFLEQKAVTIHVEIRNKQQYCHVMREKGRDFHFSESRIIELNTWTHFLDSQIRNKKNTPVFTLYMIFAIFLKMAIPRFFKFHIRWIRKIQFSFFWFSLKNDNLTWNLKFWNFYKFSLASKHVQYNLLLYII